MKTIPIDINKLRAKTYLPRVYPALGKGKPYVKRKGSTISKLFVVPTETIQRKGIVATLYKGVKCQYPNGPRSFVFDTEIQSAVEHHMLGMGFSSSQYTWFMAIWAPAEYSRNPIDSISKLNL